MIKEINIKEIPNINRGKYMDDIEEFLNSGAEACEVIGHKDQSGVSLYSALWNAVKKYGYHVKIIRRKERVFLVKATMRRTKEETWNG